MSLTTKITNVIAFMLFFGTTVYSSLLDTSWTVITPAPFVLQAWKVIDLLFLGFVIYQFYDEEHEDIVGYRFAILGLFNSLLLTFAESGHNILAFLLSLVVLSSVSDIYYRLKTHAHAHSSAATVFLHLPFSLWHGWSVFVVWFLAFAAFVPGHHHKAIQNFLAFIAIFFLTMTATGYAMFSAKGDVAGAAVLDIVLLGIAVNQHRPVVHILALVGAIISLLVTGKSAYYTYKRRDGERAPLVAGASS